jgi:hypothetical protein
VHYTCKKKKKKAKQKKQAPKQRALAKGSASPGGVQKKQRRQGHSKQGKNQAKREKLTACS